MDKTKNMLRVEANFIVGLFSFHRGDTINAVGWYINDLDLGTN